MDVQKMMEVLRQKHGVRLDADDSIFLLATIADEIQKEGREELAKTATTMVDQVSTAIVLAENNAKARGERLVTDAARWSAEQIRMSGTEAAKNVARELQETVDGIEASMRSSRTLMWMSCGAAVFSIIAAGTVALKLVGG